MEFGFAPIQSEPTFEAMSRQAGLAESNFGKPEPALAEASLRRFGEQVLPRCRRL